MRSLLALALLSVVAPAQVTLNVPSGFATIQAAINFASNGDVIVVAPGTHHEWDIDFIGKDVTVKGIAGAASTTIDGGLNSRIFRLGSGEGSGARIEGLTLTRGRGPSPGNPAVLGSGGAVQIVSAAPTIVDCIFIDNLARDGGAVFVNGAATISRCVFTSNSATFDGGGIWAASGTSISDCSFDDGTARDGAAIYALGAVTVVGCRFDVNRSTSDGGAIAGVGAAVGTLMVTSCVFEGNIAAAGGAIALDGPANSVPATIVDCLFRGNGAFDRGGGVFGTTTARAGFRGCTFLRNTSFRLGGAISLIISAVMTFESCTFGLNGTLDPHGGAIGGLSLFIGTTVELVNCVVWGNIPAVDQIDRANFPSQATVTNCDVEGGFPGVGNIDADPLFRSTTFGFDDLHLRLGSPCVDAGTSTGVNLAPTDRDGEPRVMGAAVDMGSDEFAYYPGTGEDLVLETLVGGFGAPDEPVKSVDVGDVISITIDSPLGDWVGFPPLLIGQLFGSLTPPAPSFPGIQLDIGLPDPPFVAFDGANSGPLGPFVIPPGGLTLTAVLPASLPGISIMLQGFVATGLAGNGIFVSSDGHELRGTR